MFRVTECTIEQTVISKNPYATLEVDTAIIRNHVETNTVPETKICYIESNEKDKKHKPVRYCMSTEEPVEDQQKKSETQHNLQNQNKVN